MLMRTMVGVPEGTCPFTQRGHVRCSQADMSVAAKQTCPLQPSRHVRCGQIDMSVTVKQTCPFQSSRHVRCGPCTLGYNAKGLGLDQNTRSGKTGQTGFATSHIPVTSVVIPTASKSRGQRCGKTGLTGFATTLPEMNYHVDVIIM